MLTRMKPRVGFALALAFSAGAALAQERRAFVHEGFRTPHVVYDARFHHDHYYPALGYRIAALPPGHVVVNYRSGRFFFHSGVWYQQVGPNYVVVRPPVGIVVPALPPAYTTVWVGGLPYYYANDIYYVSTPAGYAVAEPPAEALAPGTPPAAALGPQAAAPAAAGNWYYCDSSKTYYPYATQCPEGWRTVPATPPR
jgi:uncharacterized protein DUF6515